MKDNTIVAVLLLLFGLYGAYTIGMKATQKEAENTAPKNVNNGMSAQQIAATQFYPVYFTAPPVYHRPWRGRGRGRGRGHGHTHTDNSSSTN